MASASMATEYELKRLENIRRNDEMMAALKVHAKASLLSAATKPYKKKNQQKKKKEPEAPIVTRQSLRTRGLTPDSDGLPDGFSDCPKGTVIPSYVSLRVLAPLPLDDSHTQFVDTISGIARKPKFDDSIVKNEDGDDDSPMGRFDLRSLCLEPENVRRVHPERIIVVKFLPCDDVKLIAAGDKDGNNLGQEDDDGISLFQPHTAIVISSSYDGLIRLMDVEKMVFDLVYSRDEHERIFCLSQRPNDEQSLRRNVECMRPSSRKVIFCQWDLHKYRIYTIDFNPRNPNVMATSSQDGTACLWDMRFMGGNKKPNRLATVNHAKSVHSTYFSPSGLSLATTRHLVTTLGFCFFLCSRDNYVGILSGANFEDSSMIYHNNNTDRYISSFRFHCHPINVGMLAGSTVGGEVYVWTTK
ncbi:unnamed protein product [Thlaspi arvense]|uniref:Uncharacterized protein n=1 Tax=Thlaspi arvense TaxID=13288 RepID=A0AAU9RNU4_THLAR|nr:unnamed protein product [Thlaspi arvense]